MNQTFNKLLYEYIDYIQSENFFIIFKKCCGFSILRPYTDTTSVHDMVRDIQYYWKGQRNIRVYIENVELKLYDASNLKSLFKYTEPVYGIGTPICYKLQIDDGSICHCKN
jgi:hypothetical protein